MSNKLEKGLVVEEFEKEFGELEFMSVEGEVRRQNTYTRRQESVGYRYHLVSDKFPNGIVVEVMQRQQKLFPAFSKVRLIAPVVYPIIEIGQNNAPNRARQRVEARNLVLAEGTQSK